MRICLSHVGKDKLRGVNASGKFFTCGNGEFIERRLPSLQNYIYVLRLLDLHDNIKKHPLITQLLLFYNYNIIIASLGKLIRKAKNH